MYKKLLAGATLGASLMGCTVETAESRYSAQDQPDCSRLEDVIVQRVCETPNTSSVALNSSAQVRDFCQSNRGAVLRCLQSNTDVYLKACINSQSEADALIREVSSLADGVLYQTACSSDQDVRNTTNQIFDSASHPELNVCFGMTSGNATGSTISCQTKITPIN